MACGGLNPPLSDGFRVGRSVGRLLTNSGRFSSFFSQEGDQMAMENGLRGWLDSATLPKLNLRQRATPRRHRPEVLTESLFRRILCWERKRAERSGRRIVLMLVNVESILHA